MVEAVRLMGDGRGSIWNGNTIMNYNHTHSEICRLLDRDIYHSVHSQSSVKVKAYPH